MDNHKIEDFFNKSLESFNDAPSGAVWAGVNNRLGEEIPFYKKTFFVVGMVAVLFAAFGCLFCHMNAKVKALEVQNQLLNKEISTLKEDNIHQKRTLEQCQNMNEIQENDEIDFVLNETRMKPIFKSRQSASKGINNKSKEEYLLKNKANTEEVANHSTTDNSNEKETEQFIEKTIVHKSKEVESFELLNFSYLKGIAPYYSRSRKTMLNALEFNPEKERLRNKKNRLEIGLNILKTDLFLSNGINSNLGFGQSIAYKRAVNISKRLKIIGGIGYARYTYNSEITRDNLLSIADFPSLNEQLGAINQVTVTSELWNGSIGFQYDFAKRRNFTPFIKSSAIWKLYVPQKFEYELSNGFSRGHIDNSYFAYFGAVDASIGVEKEINNNHSYQVEIFLEKSLVPLGVENVNLTHLGLKTSWLF